MMNFAKKTNPGVLVGCLLVLFLLLLAKNIQADLNKLKWHRVSLEGIHYITLDDVKRYFKYKKLYLLEKKIILSNEDFSNNNDIKIHFELGSQRCRMNGWLFILSSPIIKHRNRYLLSEIDFIKLIYPVLRPAHIQRARPVNTVVLDPGHGGKDPGGLGIYHNEKVYTLKVARLLRTQLQRMGYRVVMTRDSDVFVSLDNRVRIANNYPSAIFISIHFNAGKSSANGIETFTISPQGVPHMDRDLRESDLIPVAGNIMDSASIALATAVHAWTLKMLNGERYNGKFDIEDRGIKRARFNVLTGIKIPAILLEAGFLTNKLEAKKINTEAYQAFLANSIALAVSKYCKAVDSRSASQ